MSLTLLSLRTKLLTLGLKWNKLPNIDDFNNYVDYIDNDLIESKYDYKIKTDDYKIIGYIENQFPKYSPYLLHNNLGVLNIYLLTDGKQYIFISLGLSHPILWYKIQVNNNEISHTILQKLRKLMCCYDVQDNLDYTELDYILLGNVEKLSETIGQMELNFLKAD